MKLIANPSPSTYINHEEFVQLISPLKITSNVPVTIQRVTNLPYLDGANIVVSSDCTSDETTFIPKVNIDGDSVAIEAKPSLGWLESVWFQAFWSTNDCDERNLQIATEPSADKAELATIDSYCGLDWMDAYNNCLLACPTGDIDCVSLGVEYICHQFTTCYGRIESGAFNGLDGGSSTNGTVSGSTASPVEITSTILSGGAGESTVGATRPARVSTGVASFSTESSENMTLTGDNWSTQATILGTVSSGNETLSTSPPKTVSTLGSGSGSDSDVLPTVGASQISQTSVGNETEAPSLPSNADGLNDTGVVTVTSPTETQTSVVSNNQSSMITTTKNAADDSITTQAITTSSGATTEAVSSTAASSVTTSSDATTPATTEAISSTVASTAAATESSEVTPGQTPTVKPTTLPPNYYNYNYPSISPAGSFEPTTSTYTPTYLPTSDARAYGLVVTTIALVALLMFFGFDVKIAVAGVAVIASLPFIQTTPNTIQSTGVESSQMCRYHVDVLISTCQTVHVDAPSVRLVNVDIEDMMSFNEGGCNREYNAKIVSQVEKLVLGDDTKTIETMC
jgi:hypothetical protein